MLNLKITNETQLKQLKPHIMRSRGALGEINFHIHDGRGNHLVLLFRISVDGILERPSCIPTLLKNHNYEETGLKFTDDGKIQLVP